MENAIMLFSNMLQLLNRKHEMMVDYTPISDGIPKSGIIFKPKKEFAKSSELRKVLVDIAFTLNEINSLPKHEATTIRNKIKQYEHELKKI